MTNRAATAISDWELWACAQAMVRQHGVDAPSFVERRLAALAEAEDEQGIWTWFAIDERVKQLLDTAGGGQTRH